MAQIPTPKLTTARVPTGDRIHTETVDDLSEESDQLAPKFSTSDPTTKLILGKMVELLEEVHLRISQIWDRGDELHYGPCERSPTESSNSSSIFKSWDSRFRRWWANDKRHVVTAAIGAHQLPCSNVTEEVITAHAPPFAFPWAHDHFLMYSPTSLLRHLITRRQPRYSDTNFVNQTF